MVESLLSGKCREEKFTTDDMNIHTVIFKSSFHKIFFFYALRNIQSLSLSLSLSLYCFFFSIFSVFFHHNYYFKSQFLFVSFHVTLFLIHILIPHLHLLSLLSILHLSFSFPSFTSAAFSTPLPPVSSVLASSNSLPCHGLYPWCVTRASLRFISPQIRFISLILPFPPGLAITSSLSLAPESGNGSGGGKGSLDVLLNINLRNTLMATYLYIHLFMGFFHTASFSFLFLSFYFLLLFLCFLFSLTSLVYSLPFNYHLSFI